MRTKDELFEKYRVEFDFVLSRMTVNAKTSEDLLRGLIGFAEGVGDATYADVFRRSLATPDGSKAE